MMKCPYCAEEIQPDAKKCKHCGEWLGVVERLRESGRKDIQTGAANTGGTCGCIMLLLFVAFIFVMLGGMQ